ncbi:TIGR02186 family protein, partial [Planktomarina temperata]|nr:TIGR02186 family protein [Planktomarina temperata]
MQGFFARLLFALLALSGPVSAQDIVLGMSKNEIGITAFFNGSEILIFGALKHETAASSAGDLDVVVTIASPRNPVTVRRKDKRLGIWVNVEAFDVDLAPSFYAVATTGPFDRVVSEASDLWHQISVRQLIRAVAVPPSTNNKDQFTEALVRVREEQGLYQMLPGSVQLQEQTL